MWLLACAPHHSPSTTEAERLAADASSRGWATEAGVSADGSSRSWCQGLDGPAGCLGVAERPGVGWRTLTTAGETFTWDAADFPATGGWGARLFVAGDEWTLRLVRFAGNAPTDTIELARADRLELSLNEVTLPPDATSAEMLAVVRGPGAADWICARLDRLTAAADGMLARGEVQRCSYGEYDGDKAIACIPVALPAPEVSALRARLRRDSDRHCAQVRGDEAEIRERVRGLWPL